MANYIVSKKHKKTNYIGASVVTATVLLTTPLMLNADSTLLEKVDVTEKVEKTDYTEGFKVNKSSSAKVVQD